MNKGGTPHCVGHMVSPLTKELMLTIQHVSYIHPNNELLFDGICLTVNRREKIALVGNNGSGKSTLLRLVTTALLPTSGQISMEAPPYVVPQLFDSYRQLTVAQALRVDGKLHALAEILNGNATELHFGTLNDDWTIEERCKEALSQWGLPGVELTRQMETLSGGQQTKVFLAGIAIHEPAFVLLDEPSNHLDGAGRALLYEFIRTTRCTLIVVSHDRTLLQLLDTVCELGKHGIKVYGGNYAHYADQKQVEVDALQHDIQVREKLLRKARERERETRERQQKLDARGKRKQEKAGVARIMMNTMRNRAEQSTAKAKDVHQEKIAGISRELGGLRASREDVSKMKFGFDNATSHAGKRLFTATGINFRYGARNLWQEPLNLHVAGGERIALKGQNGSGKTTLINLILGHLVPGIGSVYRADCTAIYVDQDYSLLDGQLSVFDQAQHFNASALPEHDVKIRLNRFLFPKDDWDKPCSALSGGERMRLMLCCLTMGRRSPDMIILDEPTNNLDIANIEILTAAINAYHGTLVVVSHDEVFLEQIKIERVMML